MSEHLWIVGHDGSEHADHALAWALTQAEGWPVRVEVVGAYVFPAVAGLPAAGSAISLSTADFVEAVEARLDRVLASVDVPAGVSIERRAEAGPAAQALLTRSAGEDAELLVLGQRGRGGFARLLLGSVSQQCATHALVPTVVVPHVAIDGRVTRVVVGVDGSDNSEAALRWAVTHAVPRGADIVALGAWEPPSPAPREDTLTFERMLDEARSGYERVVDAVAGLTGADITRDFRQGSARALLVEAMAPGTLVVVGQRGHRGLAGAVLGSVTTWVLHRATEPVVVVPAPR